MNRKKAKQARYPGKKNLKGYKSYPIDEDIFRAGREETRLDPEDPNRQKSPNIDPDSPNELNFGEILTGDDLDVPGSELDDVSEAAGNEDEENNYYSLGGDDHEDLEEDKG